jgi:hypothetical protein
MAKIIKNTTNMRPAVIKALIAFWLGGLLKIPSYAKNTKCPPSNTGIGNRFMKPMAAENRASVCIKLSTPSFAMWEEISAISTGPDKLQVLMLPATIWYNPLIDDLIIE